MKNNLYILLFILNLLPIYLTKKKDEKEFLSLERKTKRKNY